MLTKESFQKAAERLFDFSEYPAVRYKVLFHLLDNPYDHPGLVKLRPGFLKSDIVEELYREQDSFGGWGPFTSKDYSEKARFPTSRVAIERCLYIGLTIEDRDILFMACEYLEDFLRGTSREKFRPTNERVIPWMTALVCEAIESIKPYNPLCDRSYNEWLYIASRAYERGEYSYERDRDAQHEVFWTREKRLVPMQTSLLLTRPDQLAPELEAAMLHHQGKYAYESGHFWFDCPPAKLPEQFCHKKTRRWFHGFNYINRFHGSAVYLQDAAEWLMENQNDDGLWDYGPQTKDPWGYFGYFSTTRNYSHNRVVDCSMEVLSFLKKYIDMNFIS